MMADLYNKFGMDVAPRRGHGAGEEFSLGRRLSAPIGMLLFIAAVAVVLEGIRS